eukprot:1183501-Prorocentrum_minimum.AAC.2
MARTTTQSRQLPQRYVLTTKCAFIIILVVWLLASFAGNSPPRCHPKVPLCDERSVCSRTPADTAAGYTKCSLGLDAAIYAVRKELTGELHFRVIRWLNKVLPVNSTVSASLSLVGRSSASPSNSTSDVLPAYRAYHYLDAMSRPSRASRVRGVRRNERRVC